MILIGDIKSKLNFCSKSKQNLKSLVATSIFSFLVFTLLHTEASFAQDKKVSFTLAQSDPETTGSSDSDSAVGDSDDSGSDQAADADQEGDVEEDKDEDEVESAGAGDDATTAPATPTDLGPRDDDAITETSEVVSTRLKKMDLAGPAPEIRISSDEIFKSGRTSIADFLRDNPVTAMGATSETSGVSAGAGAAYADLRGLGSDNTLILLNGVRFPPMSGSDSVDINRIPMAIVKEIIVIKDDLSSVYGSDAIGGVINIITNQGFDGFQMNIGTNQTTLGGGEIYDFNFLAGASSAKSNVSFSLGYIKKNGVNARDREWSDSNIVPTGNPGSYRDAGGTWFPDPNCDPDDIINGPGGQFCSYNASLIATTLPETTQITMLTHIDHKFSDFTRFYSDLYYTRSRTSYIYAPAPGVFQVPGSIADGFGLPNHTPGSDMDIQFRVTPLGNRDTLQETNFFGLTSGVVHDFADTWSVTLAGSYGLDRSDSTNYGNGVASDFINLLGPDVAGGQFNPFAPVGQQGDVSSATYTTRATQIANFYTADLKLSGELGELFGAPYVLDIGLNYIQRDYNNAVDELSKRDQILTGAGSDGVADRNVIATYAQLNGRLTKSLDVYLSGRYDKFSDFGDTFNPKLGLKFRPTNDLMFRTTVGTGFKAPALSLLYAAQSDGFERFIDNVACERDGAGSTSCNPNQYRVISGGNEDLDAITSFSYSAGFVFEPSNKFDVSLDFWAVDQKGLIAGGSGGTLYEATLAEVNGIDPSTVGFVMNRDANGNLDTTNPIVAPLINLIDQKTAGLDVGLNYKMDMPLGQLIFSEAASIRLWEEAIPFPGVASRDNVADELVPQWRSQFSVGYNLLSHNLRLSMVSTDKFKGADRVQYVDSFHRFDLAYNYSGIENTVLTLGMINMLGADQPLDPSNPNEPLVTSFYSQRGPEVFMRLSKTF